MGNEPAACSKAAQKKMVNKQKIVKAIILSRSILVYLGILTINKIIKVMAATSAKNNESDIPAIEKFKVLIFPILLKGSLIININAETIKTTINE